MTKEQYLCNLQPPKGPVDVVIDTDAGESYLEMDDQFAIAYLLGFPQFTVKAIYTAIHEDPTPAMTAMTDYLLTYAGRKDLCDVVIPGAKRTMPDETTPVSSPASEHLVKLARQYSPSNPLYVLAMAPIDNIASALLLDPSIAENMVVVWLGGHTPSWKDTNEYNMASSFAAARAVVLSSVPYVQIPCMGLTDSFIFPYAELKKRLFGTPLCDYLLDLTYRTLMNFEGPTGSRILWDVTVVSWLLNADNRFMETVIRPSLLPGYDGQYEDSSDQKPCALAVKLHIPAMTEDLFNRLQGR